MDYTELTNRLYNSYDAETLCADAAQAIEALQAQLTNEHINCAMADESVRSLQARCGKAFEEGRDFQAQVESQLRRERDAALARVKELEKVIALQVENYAELSEQNDAQHGYFNSVMQERDTLQARCVELTRLAEASVPMDAHITAVAERDTALAKLAELEKQEPVAYEAVEQEIVQRYRVEKTRGGFWPCCVKAGNGTRDIFVGSQKQAEHVRQALQAACLDGAFMASNARQVPAKTLTDADIKAILAPYQGVAEEDMDYDQFVRSVETYIKGGA